MDLRLLAGPPAAAGTESFGDHRARLGGRPDGPSARDTIPALEASGLLGRGGAGFPVGRKWRSVAEQAARAGARPVVLVNGAEGEPLSSKDRTLLRLRPHLVLDGALIAADAVGADRIELYIGSEHRDARLALRRAITERSDIRLPLRIVDAPASYVAGEESAAVHFVNEGDARPTTTPPRPFERGIGGRPTLVQNVESLAAAALVARRGAGWYRETGRGATPGTSLITVTGAANDGIHEIEIGTPIAELAGAAGAGAGPDDRQAVLLGGYFGGWVERRASVAPATRPGLAARRGHRVRLRRRRVPRQRHLRRPDDRPDHGLDGRPERGPVRPVRLRPPGDGRRDRASRRRPARARRRGPARALVGADRRSRRVPPSRRRRRPAAELAPGLQRRVEAPPAPPPVQLRAKRRAGCRRAEGRLMPAGPPTRTWDRIDQPRRTDWGMSDAQLKVDRIACDGYGMCAELLPELIDLDDWGYPMIRDGGVPEALLDHARRAVAVCPVLALRLARDVRP